jgi:hypothetical protein
MVVAGSHQWLIIVNLPKESEENAGFSGAAQSASKRFKKNGKQETVAPERCLSPTCTEGS